MPIWEAFLQSRQMFIEGEVFAPLTEGYSLIDALDDDEQRAYSIIIQWPFNLRTNVT